MADSDLKAGGESKNFRADVPQETPGFHLKGCAHLGWGMKNRLSRIFDPESSRTVMLAFDHGYIVGPTTGLERLDLAIPPLIPYADCLMCTRGAITTCIPPESEVPFVLRMNTGATVLKDLSNELIGVTVEEAIRLGATAITAMVCIGDTHERESLENMSYLINEGNRYGLPSLAVTAVGKEMARDARYFSLASRVAAEIGATMVKTYYVEPGFEEITAGCPVPIVIAGGKKLPEIDALTMAWRAIDQGASGVDMGRNIFCADDPVAMIQAVRAVVHQHEKPEKALDLYNTIKSEPALT